MKTSIGSAIRIAAQAVFFVGFSLFYPISSYSGVYLQLALVASPSIKAAEQEKDATKLEEFSDDPKVQELIKELRAGKVTTRLLDAALALGQLKAKSAVAPLIDLLKDSPLETVRFVAATALGEIKDQRALMPLIKALEDNEATPWRVRRAGELFHRL